MSSCKCDRHARDRERGLGRPRFTSWLESCSPYASAARCGKGTLLLDSQMPKVTCIATFHWSVYLHHLKPRCEHQLSRIIPSPAATAVAGLFRTPWRLGLHRAGLEDKLLLGSARYMQSLKRMTPSMKAMETMKTSIPLDRQERRRQ